MISCGARLAVFDIAELRELTAYDELELDTLGDQKTALFLIMSDTDDSFNFLIAMCYTQLFNLLCDKADDVYGGRLPVHVRCLIDECANIGQIPKLEKLMATIRSREISACLILQTQLIVGGKEGLQPIEKTVIDRCVRSVYQAYFADPKPETMPILEDLYVELKIQPEPEAQRIATALEIYVHGSLNLFNHRTNVNLKNRLVCYDIKGLGKQLKKLGMLIVQDQVWNRVTINRAQKKSTRYYMDEFHLLLKEPQTAAYSVEIWKRFRKWGGIPTAITQNLKDLLASAEIENIFENSDFILMLNQAPGDREILAKKLGISARQLSYVKQSGAGEGLLLYGDTILPFVDRFPQDTELYRLMTTRLNETAGQEEENG